MGTTTEEIDGTSMYERITEKEVSTVNYYEDVKDDDTTTTETSKTTTAIITATVMMETSSDSVTTVSMVTGKMSDWIWTQWSECSKTCGHGLQRRVMHCSKGRSSFLVSWL